jgi:hypothetical protein
MMRPVGPAPCDQSFVGRSLLGVNHASVRASRCLYGMLCVFFQGDYPFKLSISHPFDPQVPIDTNGQDKVLFSLPLTKRWLGQVTLALTMVAHASMRGVIEFMSDLRGVSISPGAVHNFHQRAVRQATAINDSIELSAIRGFEGIARRDFSELAACAHGRRRPSRWRHLGDLSLNLLAQGLKHDYTIADADTGLLAHKLAWRRPRRSGGSTLRYGEHDRCLRAPDTIARSMIAVAHSGRRSSPAEGHAHEPVATPFAAASQTAC